MEGGRPDAPTFTATDAGCALVDEWQEALHTFLAGRGIVLQVLRDDRPEWWTRTELLEQIHGIPTGIAEAELGRLVEAGVVVVEGERVKASPCSTWTPSN